MRTKVLPLLLMVMFAFSVAQPIFAADPQLEDTKIADKFGNPLKDINANAGDTIELQARLYWLYYTVDESKPAWIPQVVRYLDFYVYKLNANGTNGDLVWSDTAVTNFFTANANPDTFTLTKGNYRLFVKYDGSLKHCNTTAKITIR
jgi:hypothetical protein